MVIGKSVPLENRFNPGKNVGKKIFAGLSLGLDKNQLFAGGEPARVGIGLKIGDEIGVGPFDERSEQTGDVPSIDGGGHDQNISFTDAFQDRRQVVLENAFIHLRFAGHASLATFIMKAVQSKSLD